MTNKTFPEKNNSSVWEYFKLTNFHHPACFGVTDFTYFCAFRNVQAEERAYAQTAYKSSTHNFQQRLKKKKPCMET